MTKSSTKRSSGTRKRESAMSRYIDITTINPRVYESSEVELGVLAYDYDEICAMPFLDIVRCCDCEHMYDGLKGDGYLICHKFNYFINADDFCSYGEREDE